MSDDLCSVEGCGRTRDITNRSRMCSTHLSRWKRHRDVGPAGLLRPWKHDGPCAVDGCDRAARNKGFCQMHYKRWLRSGDPLGMEGRVKVERPCSVENCDRVAEVGNTCHAHYVRARRGKTGVAFESPIKKDGFDPDPSYVAVHRRIREARGPASDYPCLMCGGQAADWSYDHLDPDQKVGVTGGSGGRRSHCPFSAKPEHYQPLCKRCHKVRDTPGLVFDGKSYRLASCKRGHEMTDENTYLHPSRKFRQCVACRKLRARQQAEKRRAEREASRA